MSNKVMTSAEKNKLKNNLLDEKIPKYELGVLIEDIKKCKNPNKSKILALLKLVEVEINKINGQVQKKLNKLDYIGTID